MTTTQPTLISLLSVLLLFVSCTRKNESESLVLKELENNLIKSNKSINLSTETFMKDLEDKSMDFCTKERAEAWYTKAKQIIQKSKALFDEIEHIKLTKKIENSKLTNLFEKLTKYKHEIVDIDPGIKENFDDDFQFVNQAISLLGGDTTRKKNIDRNIADIYALSLLAMIENDIKIIENKTIAYCNTKVGCTIMTFDIYDVLISQNSGIVRPGSEIKIKAGIGSFSKSVNPVVIIKGKIIEINEEGYALYKFEAPQKPGVYKVPVLINYYNHTIGKDESRTVNVEYTVAKECDQ